MSKDVTKVRKSAVRKQIAREIKALEKINTVLTKALDTVAIHGEDVKGDAHNQLADLLSRMNVGVTIVNTTINEKATELARTFVK